MAAKNGLAIYQPSGKQTMIYGAELTLRRPQAHMVVYFFVYSLFVNVYKPLLCPLATLARLVVYGVYVYVTGVFILWHCSLKISSAVHLILIRKAWKEVLAPAIQILWYSQAAIRSLCFYLAGILQCCAAKWALDLLVLLKQRSSPDASTARHQLHHSTHPFLQENHETYQTVLQPIMKQITVSLFLGFLDGVQEALHLSVSVAKYVLTQLFNSVRPRWSSARKVNILDDITSILPHTCMPLYTRFKGPSTSIFKDIPQTFVALKFVVATEHIISGPGKYGLDGTDIPLHARFNFKVRNAFSTQETGATLKQVKIACVLFIALYFSMLYSAINNIR